MGFTTSYLQSNNRLGRLGVIYFTCGQWKPPSDEEKNREIENNSDKEDEEKS